MRQRRNKRKIKNDLYDDLRIISKILSVLIVICLLIFIYSSIKFKKSTFNINTPNSFDISQNNETNEEQEQISNTESKFSESIQNIISSYEAKEKTPTDTTINMAFTGDIMCHNTIYNDAKTDNRRL